VVLVNSDRIDKLGVVNHRSIAVRGVIDGIHRLALRNKSIGNLMRQLPSDILGVNRREWIWKSHVRLAVDSTFVAGWLQSLGSDQECQDLARDEGGQHCIDSSTHEEFAANAIHRVG
jgi:hypothetical protein